MVKHNTVGIRSEEFIFKAICTAAEVNGNGEAVKLARDYISAIQNTPAPTLSRADYKPNGVSLPSDIIPANVSHLEELRAKFLGEIDTSTAEGEALVAVAQNLGRKEFFERDTKPAEPAIT